MSTTNKGRPADAAASSVDVASLAVTVGFQGQRIEGLEAHLGRVELQIEAKSKETNEKIDALARALGEIGKPNWSIWVGVAGLAFGVFMAGVSGLLFVGQAIFAPEAVRIAQNAADIEDLKRGVATAAAVTSGVDANRDWLRKLEERVDALHGASARQETEIAHNAGRLVELTAEVDQRDRDLDTVLQREIAQHIARVDATHNGFASTVTATFEAMGVTLADHKNRILFGERKARKDVENDLRDATQPARGEN